MDSRLYPAHHREHHHSTHHRGSFSNHGVSSSQSLPKRNYKLLIDPNLVKGASKLYRQVD